MRPAPFLCTHLEPRLLLHAGHLHTSDAPPAQVDPVEIEQLGFDHAYEHFLSAQSYAAIQGRIPPPPAQTLAGGPDLVGEWSAVQNWPRVAVHSILLPTGKLLFWEYDDNPTLWDPASGQFTNAATAGYNIFCTGHNLLADGRVLVTGGHIVNGEGLPDASIYDPFLNTWTRLPDMNLGRWYPTNTTLANGDSLVISGSFDDEFSINELPQMWKQGATNWHNLTNAEQQLPLYPFMFLSPNGKVFYAGCDVNTQYLDTSGVGAWTDVDDHVLDLYRDYGSAVMYDDGKVLIMGGGDPPTRRAEVINLNAATPAWRNIGQLSIRRRQINATILADGQVLVTGGVSGAGFNDMSTPIYSAELWNPVTETFTTMSSMAEPRWYHSTAILLPDGRVLSAGGDENPSAEFFSPPYLFNGTRPTITTAPTGVGYGQNFTIQTPDAAAITKVHLIRLTSVTHAFNMDQRINRLSFSQVAGGLQITAPTNPNLTPPGHYMLFVLNAAGTPSVAKIIQIAPAISAVATDGQAAEEGGNNGSFTFTRTGSTIGAMSVAYTLSGTATNGTDYQLLSGTVTIPNGQLTASIPLTVIPDALIEGTETAVLTITPNASRVIVPGAGSATVSITDTRPTVQAASQVYQTLPHELRFDFSRDVSASLSLADIVVQNLTTSQPIVPDALSYNVALNRATFSFNTPIPDGNYRATLDNDGIADAMGTTLAADYIFNFHFIIGDANHDGQVNLADYNILSANYGQLNRNFAQGDFNYDTRVNLIDYNLLAGRFGTVLGPGVFRSGIGTNTPPVADGDDVPDALLRLLE